MFAARCVGVSLAVFLLFYVALSLAVSQTWQLLGRAFRSHPRSASNLLFALRILPFALASAVTLTFTLPSFLLLEPRSTNESVGVAPIALGFCCLALLLAGFVRAVSAQLRTSKAIQRWLDGSSVMESSPVTVFRTGNNSPTLTVAGLRVPKVLVSETALALLTPSELQTALRHEMAHGRGFDNLKKLVFRFLAFPGMKSLEAAWSEATELAADDAAVSCFREALDMAAALIKISRLGPLYESAELTMGLLHSSTALSTRIQRLFEWEMGKASSLPGRNWRYVLPAAAATITCMVVTYGWTLTRMHAVTEWLVR